MRPKYSIYLLIVIGLMSLSVRGQCSGAQMQALKNDFQAKSANFQASQWRAHYQTALDAEPNLSQEQRDIIAEAITKTTDVLYSKDATDADRDLMIDLSKRAAQIFSPVQLKRIFYTLSADEMKGSARKEKGFVSNLTLPDCSCNISDNVLCDACRWTLNSCSKLSWGCGFGWLLRCDGNCVYYGRYRPWIREATGS